MAEPNPDVIHLKEVQKIMANDMDFVKNKLKATAS